LDFQIVKVNFKFDRLLGSPWFWYLILSMADIPEQLLALAARQEFGFGQTGPVRRNGAG
jgi:hypothetical protein